MVARVPDGGIICRGTQPLLKLKIQREPSDLSMELIAADMGMKVRIDPAKYRSQPSSPYSNSSIAPSY